MIYVDVCNGEELVLVDVCVQSMVKVFECMES